MNYCTQCGGKLVEGAQFCTACGARAGVASGHQVSVPPAVPAPPQEGAVAAPPKPRRRGRVLLATLLVLALLVAASIGVGYFVWTDASVDSGSVETLVIE